MILFLMSASPAFALRAGAARVDITPNVASWKIPLGGYAARHGEIAQGVHDQIYARALTLISGQTRAALVSVDLCFLPGQFRDLIEQNLIKLGYRDYTGSHLFLAATHTHSAPDPLAMDPANRFTSPAGWSSYNKQLAEWTAERIAQSIVKADKDSEPARMGTAIIHLKNFNRNRRGGSITDTAMSLLRIESVDHKPIASLVVFAAHPTLYTAKMLKISADWPGVMEDTVEQDIGGMCLYFNGAEGDAAPIEMKGLTESEQVTAYGKMIGNAAAAELKEMDQAAESQISSWIEPVTLPAVKPNGLFLAAAGQLGMSIDQARERAHGLMPSRTMITFVHLGKLLLIGMPCEPTGSLGLEVESMVEQKGFSEAAVTALTNDWIAYALTPEQYRAGGYEVGMSLFGDRLGPVLVNAIMKGIGHG